MFGGGVRGVMAARLLSHANSTAVSSTPASRLSPSHVGVARRAAPPSSSCAFTNSAADNGTSAPSSSPSSVIVKDKVPCVCGTTINDGKPMVECTNCGAWSHLHCLRLTQRTAKKAICVIAVGECFPVPGSKCGMWKCLTW